jgi:hypothetical protein
MCARWPLLPGSRGEASRAHIRHMYDLAFKRLADGLMLPAYWYERMVRLVHAYFTGDIPDDLIRDRLDHAMNGC